MTAIIFLKRDLKIEKSAIDNFLTYSKTTRGQKYELKHFFTITDGIRASQERFR